MPIPFWRPLKMHGELIAAIVCGALIILAYLLPKASVPLLILAFIIGGFAKAKEGITELVQKRSLNIEILMIAAAIGAGLIGYWEEGALLIFIFSLSGALETYTWNKSERDLSELIRLQPDQATRIQNGTYETVPVQALAIGELVLVKAGERFPIDGIVVQGESEVDEAPITGESIPVWRKAGDPVRAGTLNRSGSIVMEVTMRAQDTLFQKIVRLVQEARQDRAATARFIEKFEKTYVKVVLAAVALMFVAPPYLFNWSWEETWYRALVLLVVASPCALVASVSPAVLSALSRSARNGLLIKGGSHLERLADIKVVAMDKTGTITTGEPEVTDIWIRDVRDQSELLACVASLERHSAHPLASAIVRWADEHNLPDIPLSDVQDLPGKGITGIVNGVPWKVGSAEYVGKKEAEAFLQTKASRDALHGKTVVFARDDQGIALAVALQDGLRREAKQAVQALKNQGIRVVMITGDRADVAHSLARQAGFDEVFAEALPDEKMQIVSKLRRQYGPVLMIGDGINDAPALAKADVGAAMGAGTDVALNTADLVLVKNNLCKISEAIRISKKMNRIVKQNIFFSISVIILLVAVNFLQFLSLPLGVIGHEGSTLLVILNGLRLLRAPSDEITAA